MANNDNRFVVTYEKTTFVTDTKIIVDKETGVNYLFRTEGAGGGLTVLLDRDGKPVITTVFNEE